MRAALVRHYEQTGKIPPSLEAAGLPGSLPGGASLSLDPESMTLEVHTALGELDFVPRVDEQTKRLFWVCKAGPGLTPQSLPPACKEPLP